MILKSFYRKKTTKIYLLIFILFFSVLGTVILGKNYYVEKSNENLSGSFLYISSSKKIDFTGVKNVKSVNRALTSGVLFFIDDDSVSGNNVLFPSYQKRNSKYQLNNQVQYTGKYNTYTFTITGYYNYETLSSVVYINPDTLEQISEEEGTYDYLLRLNNWNKEEDTVIYLMNKYNVEPYTYIFNSANIDFTQNISTFTIYTYLIIAIFIIVSIFTIHNIINDEKLKNDIYRSLGYSKKKLFKLQLINISSLFGISLIISIILTIIIKIIFKI